MGMLHLIYRIVNIQTAQYYIGIHSTKNINDGYMGSGTLIKAAIKKHGLSAFKREVIELFETREKALQRESELVTKDTLSDPLCYNLIIGGQTGISTIPERRELFYTKAPELVFIIPINPYNKTYHYIFELKEVIVCQPKYSGWKFSEKIAKFAEKEGYKKLLVELSNLFNDKESNQFAKKQLQKLCLNPAFAGNVLIKTIPWPRSKVV